MRTITDAQRQALEDLSAQGILRGLLVQIAEKDIHITKLLKGLSTLEVHHDRTTGFWKGAWHFRVFFESVIPVGVTGWQYSTAH